MSARRPARRSAERRSVPSGPPRQTGTYDAPTPTRSSDTMAATARRSARGQVGDQLPGAEVVQRVTRSSWFLSAEGDELHRHLRRIGRRQPGQLEQHGDAGAVVLRARGLRDGVQMSADHHVLGPPVESGRLGDHIHRGSAANRHAPRVAGRHPDGGPAHPVPQVLQSPFNPVRGLGVVPRGRLPRADVTGQVFDVSLDPTGVEADRARRRRRSGCRRRCRRGDLGCRSATWRGAWRRRRRCARQR